MQRLTTGAMEDFTRYLGIKRKLLMCSMFWIFSAAEANTILEVVGSTVMLPCNNQSLSKLSQLTWKMNGFNLLSYRPDGNLHISPEAVRLSINMSLSKDQLYKLIIERADKSHTGNYTCETNTQTGAWEQTWELIITDHPETENATTPLILVAVTVPCVCCLIFIFALMIMRRTCKRCAENQCPRAEVRKQPEDIYENCLEINVSQRSGRRQPYH